MAGGRGVVGTAVFEDVEREVAEAAAALVPGAARVSANEADVPTRGRCAHPRTRLCRRKRRSDMVGRVGLEPTTQGL
jgi:hypothetical protein